MAKSKYTKEEIEHAQAELDDLSPEGYLDLVNLIKQLEENANLGEAGGIAWTDLFTKHGNKVSVTSRAAIPEKAIDGLYRAVEHGINVHEMSPSPQTISYSKSPKKAKKANTPATPPPAQPQQVERVPVGDSTEDGANLKTLPITTIQKKFGDSGNWWVICKSEPPYHKYGVRAFPEVLPDNARTAIEGWEVDLQGKEFQPFPEMKFALYDEEQKKVKAFRETA